MKQLTLNLDEPNTVCPSCQGVGWNWHPVRLEDDTKYLCQQCKGLGYVKDPIEDFDYFFGEEIEY